MTWLPHRMYRNRWQSVEIGVSIECKSSMALPAPEKYSCQKYCTTLIYSSSQIISLSVAEIWKAIRKTKKKQSDKTWNNVMCVFSMHADETLKFLHTTCNYLRDFFHQGKKFQDITVMELFSMQCFCLLECIQKLIWNIWEHMNGKGTISPVEPWW